MRSAVFILALLYSLSSAADEFLAGYAAALLEQHLPEAGLRVVQADADGTVVISGSGCPEAEDRARLVEQLRQSSRIRRVEWQLACELAPAELPAPPQPEEPTPLQLTILPQFPVFDPLRADQREPQFNVRYQRHTIGEDETFNAGDVAFGGYLGIAQGDAGKAVWQWGLQGAVFALFNLDAPSNDLVNADYWIGIPYSYRRGRWSYRIRVYHQSSHLGDEFLLRNPELERINLSYEVLDGLLAYRWHGLRVYGGGGYVLHSEPDLEPWAVQYGLEYEHEDLIGEANLILAADVKRSQEQDWAVNRSYRAGFSFNRRSREIGVLLEHYNGYSPNGQFFTRDVEYTGIGLYIGL